MPSPEGPRVQRVAVIGTGLIGTSVALAARRAGVVVVGWDVDADVLAAAASGGGAPPGGAGGGGGPARRRGGGGGPAAGGAAGRRRRRMRSRAPTWSSWRRRSAL